MIRVVMVIPNWKKECGIAEYTKQIVQNINESLIKIKIIDQIEHFLLNLNKMNRIDIVHFQYEYSMYDTSVLKKIMLHLVRLKIPIVITFHSFSNNMKLQHYFISKFSSSIIVHSEQFKQLCIKHGFPENKLMVIPMGCQSFSLESLAIDNEQIDTIGYPSIGFFGFPFPNKGIINLIDSINSLQEDFPKINGHFFSHLPNSISSDHPAIPFQNKLELKITQFNHIKWYRDYLPESTLIKLLNKMDVNVLPYFHTESNGISSSAKLLLSAKKPIITTNSLHFSDLSNEVYKIPDADVSTITNAIREVLTNKNLQDKLLKEAKNFVIRNNWKNIAVFYSSYYKKLVSNRNKNQR
jgi:glycosyltransferase involved in cell wall biosynthesis